MTKKRLPTAREMRQKAGNRLARKQSRKGRGKAYAYRRALAMARAELNKPEQKSKSD